MGGGIGGVAELIFRFDLKEEKILCSGQKLNWGLFFILLISQIPIGICGAAAITFVFSSTTWFPTSDTPIHRLWLVSLSVVAGYGAKRFMALVTRKLERDIAHLNEEIEENRERVEEVERLSLSRDIVTRAMSLLGPPLKATTAELHSSLIELSEWLKKYPTDRTPAIVAGRIYRALDNYQQGIALLSEFIRAKERAAEKDTDYADVLYQRACYKCLLFARKLKEAGKPDEELRASGLRDLEESTKINPSNGPAAAEDEDFAGWATDESFLRLTKT